MHKGAAFFRDEVLPNLPDIFDFARFSYDSVVAEAGRVAGVVNMGVTGTDATIKLPTIGPSETARSRRSGSPISNLKHCSTGWASPTRSPTDGRTDRSKQRQRKRPN